MLYEKEYKDFLIDYQEKSNRTIAQYMNDIKTFEAWALKECGTELINVTKEQINEYIRYCRDERNNKPLTLNTKIAALRSVMDYYVSKGIMEHNVANDVKSKKVVREEPVYLTQDEAMKLLNAVANDNRRGVSRLDKTRDYAIFQLFLTIGLRSSELANLEIGDIDFRTNKLKVKKAKGNKTRTLILSQKTIQCINEYLEIREMFDPSTDKLFVARGGGQYTPVTMGRKVKAYCKIAGLDSNKIHTHTLRHTAATLTYSNSNDIVSVKTMLGHSDIRTTQIYLHMIDEKLQEAMLSNPLA